MSQGTLDITEAREQISRLAERLRNEQVIRITRRNRPVFAVVDLEYLEAILETIEILSDPESQRVFMESLEDIKRGRLHDHEDVKRELLCQNRDEESRSDGPARRRNS